MKIVSTLACLLVSIAACAGPTLPASPPPNDANVACAIDPGEAPIDVGDRADGVYAFDGARLGDAPLASFDDMTFEEKGVDAASGKPWLHVRLGAKSAGDVMRYTGGPPPRGIAVVVGGRLAAKHKVKSAITSPEMQVSCCDPRACEAWEARLGAR